MPGLSYIYERTWMHIIIRNREEKTNSVFLSPIQLYSHEVKDDQMTPYKIHEG